MNFYNFFPLLQNVSYNCDSNKNGTDKKQIGFIIVANPMWADYRELGFGWWMRNNASLRRCIEKLAKAAYQSQGDPLDAAIYYLAMKKKNLVWGLFRQVQNERMTAFFSNNFTEERWRKAALKNAYALLGKQRFDHAVAFFLLAGSLKGSIGLFFLL
jgi:hypothetical protein